MPRLHPRTIDAVKERADIVDVVGEHVVLKKKGREFVGVCPFHDDSKPSMTVAPLMAAATTVRAAVRGLPSRGPWAGP